MDMQRTVRKMACRVYNMYIYIYIMSMLVFPVTPNFHSPAKRLTGLGPWRDALLPPL